MAVVGPTAPAVGGVVTFQNNLVSSSLGADWRFVRLSTSRPQKTKTANNYGYGALFNSGPRRLLTGVTTTARNAFHYPAQLRLQRVSLVQIQSSCFFSFWECMTYYVPVAKLWNLPVAVRYGGDFRYFYGSSNATVQRVIRYLLELPDAIIVQSEGWKRFFSTLTDPDRLHIIGNAVAVAPAPPDRSRRGLPRALFVCTQDATRKGLMVVLKAAGRLRGKVRLVFVAATDETIGKVREMGLNDVVELHGFTDSQGMRRHYDDADMLLIPSFQEGFPNTMLEAMAAALPIVATPVGAMPEVLEPGQNGLMIQPGDADELAAATALLAADPDLRQRMGLANYSKVRDEYEQDVVLSRYDKVWRSALQVHDREGSR